MPIHVAITRRVRAGREAEFQEALREFFKTSFGQGGVLGASMLTPPPGSNSREFGILRTFADEKERDAFYNSPMFTAWEARARTLTEGEPVYRQLHGLEAWFRSPTRPPPPRWKMALLTLLGVYPVSLLIGFLLSPQLRKLPLTLNLLAVSALIVTCLTWVVMPRLTRWFKDWLYPQTKGKEKTP
jgi:antibiotic biosynthesis monooxygenase (ABM) superfamily enzyme